VTHRRSATTVGASVVDGHRGTLLQLGGNGRMVRHGPTRVNKALGGGSPEWRKAAAVWLKYGERRPLPTPGTSKKGVGEAEVADGELAGWTFGSREEKIEQGDGGFLR
jgi:hypothetical protein